MHKFFVILLFIFLFFSTSTSIIAEDDSVELGWFDRFANEHPDGGQADGRGFVFDIKCYGIPQNYWGTPESYMDDVFDWYEACGLVKARTYLGLTGFFIRAYDPCDGCEYLMNFEEKEDADDFVKKYMIMIFNTTLSPIYDPFEESKELFDDFAFDYIQERSRVKKEIKPYTSFPFRYAKVSKRTKDKI